jgi:hypothetical protein
MVNGSRAPALQRLWRAPQPAPPPADCFPYRRRRRRHRQYLRRRRRRHSRCHHHLAAAAAASLLPAQLQAAGLPRRRQAAVPLWAGSRRRCPRWRARSRCGPPRPGRLPAAAPRPAPGPVSISLHRLTTQRRACHKTTASVCLPLCYWHTCFRAARRAAADRWRFPGGAFSRTACRISSAAAGSGTGEMGLS